MRATEKKRSVLIAAQDPRVTGLIQQYLLQIGFEVHCEYNLDAALDRLVKARVDLLIVDGEMPEKVLGNFVEAVARIKPGVPSIAVGISEHETQGKKLSAFVSAFIEKPFSISDISNSIKATLHAGVPKQSGA
ncbi:MAG TPA: response regulator [Candidatus Kryptobacter bacterium]|nr:response regulator [Candidatus Kryptobacter bacterium]